MFTKRRHNKASAGVTLVEMMIATGLTGMIAMGVAVYLSQQRATVKKIESNLRMQSIASRVSRHLGDPKTISFSAWNSNQPGNLALRNCVDAVSNVGTTCTATNPQQQQSFDLVLNIVGTPTAAQLNQNTIAGHDDNRGLGPMWYQLLDGVKCMRGGNRAAACNIKVRTFFWATCPPSDLAQRSLNVQFAPTSCNSAQTLHFRYQVSYHPQAAIQGSAMNLNLTNIPDDRVFYNQPLTNPPTMSTSGAITLNVNTIPGAASLPQACPSNSTMTGIVNGKPTCACMYPFRPVPGCLPGQTCACVDSPKTCLPNERFRGIDLNGNIICCQVYCQAGVPVNANFAGSGCQFGGWIESVTAQRCTAASECRIGKWGGSCTVPVNCPETHTCCYDYVPGGGAAGNLSCTAR